MGNSFAVLSAGERLTAVSLLKGNTDGAQYDEGGMTTKTHAHLMGMQRAYIACSRIYSESSAVNKNSTTNQHLLIRHHLITANRQRA